ncbi:dehydrogenase [Paenibacillus sp. J31TS4]|uniref:Gfo/Idh/MocA family protein n=1 Tax=Paenibacillus sp. J31TS4 TaxID=2807195 RepID=UPI001B0B578E|nr:Gfo/Idh/MocA family oxidoreductase [Paenibacillus sp. J31TS4]GIP41037.1 dehydrogenase [Paenibacillus sp. J31TS4]
MNHVKVGMISFAHGHAFSYLRGLLELPNVTVTGIADEVRDRVAGVVEKHGLAYYEDYRELLKTDIDAVVICSENVHHAQQTIDSANAGKHVLCEKPLGISTEEMQRMIDVCREKGVQLMTAFPCRYITAVLDAKAAIERGEIGEILAIKGTNRGTMPGSWFIEPELSGGGAVLDHTVHVMDLMNWFLDSPVAEVYAEAGTFFHDIKVDDSGMVHVKFENGVIAALDTSWSRPKMFPTWGDVTMEIVGTKGVVSIDSFNQKNEVFSNLAAKPTYSGWGDSMDGRLVEGFVNAIANGTPVPITGEDGLKSAQVALAAYESIAQKKAIKL